MSRKKGSIYNRFASLLRYPGSKSRLADYIADSFSINNISPKLFVEPFCGGASVSISLLEAGIVESIGLADTDPLIASFWKVVFSDDAKRLCDKIESVEISLDRWKKIKSSNPKTPLNLAFKCLFLNRTSFSGILHPKAGPLGGWSQAKRNLGCRFQKEKLIKRILELSQLKERVKFVLCGDYKQIYKFVQREIHHEFSHDGIFWYFDPPFFHKANQLYGYYFEKKDHKNFKQWLFKITDQWILSYDDVIEVRRLYKNHKGHAQIVEMIYSASKAGGASVIGREVVLSNLPSLPSSSSMNVSNRVKGFVVFSGEQNLSLKAIEHSGPIRRKIVNG